MIAVYWVHFGENCMNYATTIDEAKEWGISQRRVVIYCKEGRIDRAELLGRTWFITQETTKPIDPRRQRKLDEARTKQCTRECVANGKT